MAGSPIQQRNQHVEPRNPDLIYLAVSLDDALVSYMPLGMLVSRRDRIGPSVIRIRASISV